ncbi:MAG: EAL domain-containing protein [Sulfuritalea sp.]|nr:EAL domain-containing protein [Sulfuritalea sp.]
MSIRARLVLSFSVLLGLLFAVTTVSLQRFEGLTAKTQEIVDYQAYRVFLAQRANRHAQTAAIYLLNLLQTPDREKRVPLYAAMDAEIAASDVAVSELGKTMLPPEVQADIERVTDLRQRYGALFQETVELIELEGPEKARGHFEDRTQRVLNTLLFETLELENHLQRLMNSELEDLRKSAANARLLAIILALSALITGSILAWTIARSIVIPVREAVSVAESIASGDYQKAVPHGKQDEIGALLRSLTIMRDSIATREDSILRLAYVDTLTRLPNRTRFLEMLDTLPADGCGALVILGIDRFTPINNALGHTVGDRLLCEIAGRLRQAAGDSSVVARLWGDQFALLIDGADRNATTVLVQQILATLRAPMIIDGQHLDIDASFGVALYPQDGTNATRLLRRADLAMANAKRRHESLAFGSDLDAEPAHEQLSLIGEMRAALARREFVVYYQPKLNLAQNRITGAEALIRWQHPEKGMIPPLRFIPFAEQTGFIREITPWILEDVIRQAAQWQRSGMDIVTSVNLSTHDLLNRDLVAQVLKLLEDSGLPASRLCLEITESALMDEPELALKHLDELAAHGIKLAIDDYGTGQASLAYVKTLPVDELKIDRAFITDIDATPKNAAIVRSTILLCRELGLTVVAEGAETEAEISWLKSNVCDVVQGYGVAKPMALQDFLAWVREFNGIAVSPTPTF